jgi:hypothetical protein
MSKLLRIAPAAALFAATTVLAPAIPAKDHHAATTTQVAQNADKDAKTKDKKEVHHKKGAKNSDSQGSTASTDKPGTPKK